MPEMMRPQCPERSAAGTQVFRCVMQEGHGFLGYGPGKQRIDHNFTGIGPYTSIIPDETVPRYRIHGKGDPVVIVTADTAYQGGPAPLPDLQEGWVWVLSTDPFTRGLGAAERSSLVELPPAYDMRTISGGVRLGHGFVRDWVEQEKQHTIPTIDIEMTRPGPLRLRRADITELCHILGLMVADMPPDPLMPG